MKPHISTFLRQAVHEECCSSLLWIPMTIALIRTPIFLHTRLHPGAQRSENRLSKDSSLPYKDTDTNPKVSQLRVGLWRSLDFGLQTVHVYGTVVFVFMVWRRVGGLLLVGGPDALLQLHETGHVRRQALGSPRGAQRGGLEAAVFLIGHHLLDADHGPGLTDERNLWTEEMKSSVL